MAGLPFGWGAIFGLLNLLLGGGILTAWVKLRPKMRELEKNAEEKLRDDLIARVEKLEKKLDEERVSHEAEMTVMRHRLNNSEQCLDALLLLLKAAPNKVAEAVKHIEEMRVRHKSEEALEKGAIVAAKIAVAAPPPAG